jgi:hypothetical protein
MKANKKYYHFFTVSHCYESELTYLVNMNIDRGAEIFGNSTIHYHGSPTNKAYTYVPMRIELTEEEWNEFKKEHENN